MEAAISHPVGGRSSKKRGVLYCLLDVLTLKRLGEGRTKQAWKLKLMYNYAGVETAIPPQAGSNCKKKGLLLNVGTL